MTSTTSTAASARVTQTFSIARLDEQAVVRADGDLHALGQGRADLLGHRLGGLGDGQRVGARLADDAEADRRIAVEAEGGIGIFRPLLDPGDVAEPDQIAVGAAADDQLGELLAASANGRSTRSVTFCCARFEPAGGKLDILACAARSRRRPGSGRRRRAARAASRPASPAAPRRR